MSTALSRDREDDDELSRSPKRIKVDVPSTEAEETVGSETHCTDANCILPPSHILLGNQLSSSSSCTTRQLLESDVGITEYISRDIPPVLGIIKQRFTDFLVFEVDLDYQVVHLKSLDKPVPTKKDKKSGPWNNSTGDNPDNGSQMSVETAGEELSGRPRSLQSAVAESSTSHTISDREPVLTGEVIWDDSFKVSLSPYFSEGTIAQLEKMYLEGPEPKVEGSNNVDVHPSDQKSSIEQEASSQQPAQEKQDRNRSSRGERGRKLRGRGETQRDKRGDTRMVFSEPISSKADRTAVHQIVRELFKGKLETETESHGDQGSRIVVMWSRRGGGRGSGVGRGERPARGDYPPYIHFTMQKTNRDTQDALAYLARTLHVNVKDFGVAGTKDKRGVTVQRVSLRRGNKLVEDIWKAANQIGRKSIHDTSSQRGEHGIRIADLCYRKAGLELGMLKGNEFIITLRNLQANPRESVDQAMNSLKHKGFINYYGMQRFGTAAVPTHSIGLAFLKSDWHRAVSLILQVRPGEHPDVVEARQAWLVDRDLDLALALMPRRVVAERCILESYKKQGGDTRNALGALSTIPRNLRLMYIHAYQSYVWNAVVSERISVYGCDKAVPGDLVFGEEQAAKVGESDEINDGTAELAEDEDEPGSRSTKRLPWVQPKIKTLSTEDAHRYSIFDVIMPLPGRDVAYPGGSLGERYREFLRKDGLDPDDFLRKQREYILNGSYRKILQLPRNLSWSILRYTDPDVALAQADEDKLLGFDPLRVTEGGKFLALQVNLTLSTAAYATMALRELTKTETSSHFQTGLTQASEDQQFRGTVTNTDQDTPLCEQEMTD